MALLWGCLMACSCLEGPLALASWPRTLWNSIFWCLTCLPAFKKTSWMQESKTSSLWLPAQSAHNSRGSHMLGTYFPWMWRSACSFSTSASWMPKTLCKAPAPAVQCPLVASDTQTQESLQSCWVVCATQWCPQYEGAILIWEGMAKALVLCSSLGMNPIMSILFQKIPAVGLHFKVIGRMWFVTAVMSQCPQQMAKSQHWGQGLYSFGLRAVLFSHHRC